MDHTQDLIGYLMDAKSNALKAHEINRSQGDIHQIFNLSSALNKSFQIGLIFWRKGETARAYENLLNSVRIYNQKIFDAEGFGAKHGFWRDFWEGNCREEAFPAAAAYLTGAEFNFADTPNGISRFEEQGYRAWHNSKLILACMGFTSISRDELERSIDLAKTNRSYPNALIKLTQFHFEVLTGQWSNRPPLEMLNQHSRLYAGLQKIRGLPDLTYGEGQHNDRVVDWIFACILKRTGWSGRYLHAWPQDAQPAETGDARETFIEPRSFLAIR